MKRKLEKENVKAAKPKVRKDEVIDRKERVVDSSDERSMIIEQNRLLRIRQKRKNRWKRRTGVGILMLCAAGGIWYLLWGRKLIQTSESGAVQVTASPEQEIVYARLDSVKGNEITYTVAKEYEQTGTDKTGTDKTRTEQAGTEQAGTDQTGTEKTGTEKSETEKTGTEQPKTGKTEKRTEEGSYYGENNTSSGFTEGSIGGAISENPSGAISESSSGGPSEAMSGASGGAISESSSGGPSEAMSGASNGASSGASSRTPSGRPSGAMHGDSGGIMNGAPDGVMSGMQNNTGDFTYNNTVYQLTEETGQDMIPVGTPVTTRLGTVTTFSRLAAGDYVALVMEEDGGKRVIAAVYIVG